MHRGGSAGHFEWSNSMNRGSGAKLWPVIVPKIGKNQMFYLIQPKNRFSVPYIFLELANVLT